MKIRYQQVIAAVLLACSGVAGCIGEQGEGREIDSDDPHLRLVKGVLYLADIPFTGHLLERYDSANLRSSTPYSEGRIDGTTRAWYPDGSVMERRIYVAGRKEGVHEGWWENGAQRFSYTFENDLHEGNAREWFDNGQVFRDFNYVDGREEGMQTMYFEDGSIRANYRVIDGRRYGSIGSKPCRSEN